MPLLHVINICILSPILCVLSLSPCALLFSFLFTLTSNQLWQMAGPPWDRHRFLPKKTAKCCFEQDLQLSDWWGFLSKIVGSVPCNIKLNETTVVVICYYVKRIKLKMKVNVGSPQCNYILSDIIQNAIYRFYLIIRFKNKIKIFSLLQIKITIQTNIITFWHCFFVHYLLQASWKILHTLISVDTISFVFSSQVHVSRQDYKLCA